MRRYWKIGAGIVALIIVIIIAASIFSGKVDLPTAAAQSGEFVITLTENGELKAQRAVSVVAPRVRGKMLITKLAPEGSVVKAGDFLIQFDASEQHATLQDNQANLKIAQANLNRALADLELQKQQLELDLEKAERNAKEKAYEAPAIKQEAEKELELARLKKETQLKLLEADIEKLRVEVDRAKDKVTTAQNDLAQMTLKAPIPGLVVYMDIWKGNQMAKVQEGDSPWPGQELINLPDLSAMQVKTSVSEVDVDKLKLGQETNIKLDAYPEPTFHGKVTKISTLARRKDWNSRINVFDVEVTLDSADPKMKPGMSAKADIVVEKIPNSIWVPIEAVFEKEGKTVVYLMGSRSKKVEVEVGKRSDTHVAITKGLKGGEKVALVDPTQKLEMLGVKKEEKK